MPATSNTRSRTLEREPTSIRPDVVNVLRGFCMGAADIVPGVSGGTVALVLGHYQRLVLAISHFDAVALRLVAHGMWQQLARHTDLRFMLALGCGVLAGIASLNSLMHWLLEHRMPETLAIFFGLVLASSYVVARGIARWNGANVLLALLGAVGAFVLCGLTPTHVQPSYVYLFFAASLAICAMILPGISGAFVLLLLGVYHPITGLVKDFFAGQWSWPLLLQLTVFALGCVTGLALFSRLLRRLLTQHRDPTFAALLGLMVGSLRRLWPLQQATAETAQLKFSQRQWQSMAPAEWQGPIWPLIALAAAAFAAVIILEVVGRRVESAGDHSAVDAGRS